MKISFIEARHELVNIVKNYIVIESLEDYEKLWILPNTGKLILFNSGIDIFLHQYDSNEDTHALPKDLSVVTKVNNIVHLGICDGTQLQFPLLGVELSPTACNHLFSYDSRINDEGYMFFEDCLKPTGVSFEKLYEIDGVDEQIAYIENGLLSLKEKASPVENNYEVIESIIEHINKNMHRVNVSDILEKFEYSRTSLERDFKKMTGYTAKEFIQIIRFCDIFKDLIVNGYHYMELEHEFFDQSHMNKAFKKFIDIPPSKLQAYVKDNNIEIYQLQKTYE